MGGRGRHYWRRLAIFAGLSGLAGLIFVLAWLVNLQVNAFITPYRNSHISMPETFDYPYQEIRLATADGLQIAGWYIPGSRPEGIILVHGIDANRTALLPQAAILAEAGYHLVLIDLRAHGQSEGTVNSYGYREALDVQAATDYLLERPAVEQVAALGTSLGGAVVVRAAAEDPRLQALVLESSYSSLPAAVEDAFDERSTLPRRPFAPLLVALAQRRVGVDIGQVDSVRDLAHMAPRPVLIIHGTEDRLFPPDHARRLYQAAPAPKELWLVEGLGHASPLTIDAAAYRERLLAFFEKAFSPGG